MFIKYYIFISLLKLATSISNVNDYSQHDCGYLQEDYENLYNTSLNLYAECVKQADYNMELYENEMQISDMLMESLHKCDNVTANLSNSVNYTSLIMSKRENIELEAELLLLKKNINKCEETHTIELSLISEYKAKVLELENTIKSLADSINLTDNEVKNCQENLNKQKKSGKILFENLNDCLEREEKILDQRDRYVLKLTSCRKNNRKFKVKLSE